MRNRNNSTFNKDEETGRHEHPLRQEISHSDKAASENAFEEAMDDIEQDPDLSVHSPNDDLDEDESARLGEENTGLI